MVLRVSSLGVAAILVLAPSMVFGADPKKVETKYDLVYTKAGGEDLKLDIAWPGEGDGPFPAVLVIHGGGWRGGNKKDSRPVLLEFAKRGYVAVSPQYRFVPKSTFPAQIHDVKAAVRWVKAHAKEYKVDVEHVGATGFSAGGHLSMMLGATQATDGLEGDVPSGSPDSSVQAVVNYFGPTDLTATDFPGITRPLIKDFVGDDPKTAAEASPTTFLNKGDAPILAFQGTKDALVPTSQAIKLSEVMTAKGVPGRVEILVGAGHGWGGDELLHTMNETFAFFDKYLKPSARSKP